MTMSRPAGKSSWESISSLVQRELAEVEEKVRLHSSIDAVDGILESLQDSPGKRLRPMLLLFSGQASGRLRPTHVDLAAAVELVHCATLIHDDVVDNAEMRRGRPCVHRSWGETSAVLVGDILFSEAFKLAAELNSPPVTRTLCTAVIQVCEGEVLQWQRSFDLDVSDAECIEFLKRKTGSLCWGSCRVGALLAGGAPEAIEALARFGEMFGTAYQIMDDCIDLFGASREEGKTLGCDLLCGRYTLPVIRALAAGRGAGDARLEDALRSGESASARQLLLEEDVYREAAASARQEAEVRIRQAKAELAALEPSQAREALQDMADMVLRELPRPASVKG